MNTGLVGTLNMTQFNGPKERLWLDEDGGLTRSEQEGVALVAAGDGAPVAPEFRHLFDADGKPLMRKQDAALLGGPPDAETGPTAKTEAEPVTPETRGRGK